MKPITRAQRTALHVIYLRVPYTTYRAFRRLQFTDGYGAVMVRFAGMWLGVERDGHTHS